MKVHDCRTQVQRLQSLDGVELGLELSRVAFEQEGALPPGILV